MIKDLKDLERLLKLCRKQGVTDLKLMDVEFKLGDLPRAEKEIAEEVESDDPYASFPAGDLTNEQLMFYSSGGLPENDPHRKDQ